MLFPFCVLVRPRVPHTSVCESVRALDLLEISLDLLDEIQTHTRLYNLVLYLLNDTILVLKGRGRVPF